MSEKLTKKNPDNNSLEKNLFHATDDEAIVKGICYQNFDPRMHGKNATVYGRGAYFAENASYSSGYASSGSARYMFCAKVLVGKYTRGDSSMMRPPNLPGSQFELYDSTVNDVNNPSIYVIYDKSQCYPQHLILYSPAQAQVKGRISGVQSQPASTGASTGAGGSQDPTGASGQATHAAQTLQSLGMSPTVASATVAAAQALHAAATSSGAAASGRGAAAISQQTPPSPSQPAPQGPKNKNCIVM